MWNFFKMLSSVAPDRILIYGHRSDIFSGRYTLDETHHTHLFNLLNAVKGIGSVDFLS